VAEKRKKTPKTNGDEQTPKSRLSPAEIEHFQQLLLQKRTEILGNVSEIEGEALRKSRLDASGDLSSMPIHMADLGTDNFEQEFSLDLMDSERRLLVEIEDALHRIETGTYGICEGTGKPISKARLEAQPWARYSLEYTRMIEEGRVREGP
jgi:RNA polymerase-binding protein DksA